MFQLTSDQETLRKQAADLARHVIAERAARIDRTEAYPWDNVEALTEAGFMGMTVPTAYGGRGLSFLDAALVVEEMAKVCGITARIVVEANMGGIAAVMKYGNETQKQLAAALVLAGDKPAICITEPEAGSAASELTTRADQRGDRYVLNGQKHWITGGGVSTSRAASRASALSSPYVARRKGWRSASVRIRWACAAFRKPRCSSATWRFPPR